VSGARPRRPTRLGVVVWAVAVIGCYHGTARTVSLSKVDAEPGWTLVRGVRVLRQESERDCGVVALAMVLDRWGVRDASADIRREISAKPDRGVAARSLRAFARARGFRAFLISGNQADLVNEVRASRPVLVGLVQRYTGQRALSHYEVVIGINEERGLVLLLDPGHGPREDELASFDREWKDAGRLTLVVSPS
jgi:predicted double-glycine peptidase